jgi:hypothetical protein
MPRQSVQMNGRSLLAPSRASTNTPELFSYIVRYDDGAAPDPYWGTCTLVICKPAIRRKANVGDWIVGLGSKANPTKVDYSRKIVYVMKVTRKMTMERYDRYANEHLHNKIPVMPAPGVKLRRDGREWRLRLGDCIYDFSQKGKPQRPGVHKRKNRITDISGGERAPIHRIRILWRQGHSAPEIVERYPPQEPRPSLQAQR